MNVWFKLSATFHEHPKMLVVRRRAGSRADSAELGWYRLLMAAKRYGRWAFASEEHLEHASGSFYRYVSLYREAGLLDDLVVHDGDSYNAVQTDAERKAAQRERDRMSRAESRDGVTPESDVGVTLDREREETERVRQRGETAPANDPWNGDETGALQWLAQHGCYIAPGNGYDRHLVTMVTQHGIEPVVEMFERLSAAGMKNGDVKGFVFGAQDALDSQSRPNLTAVERSKDIEATTDRHSERVQKQMWARRMELWKQTGQWDEAWGAEPEPVR